MEWRGYSLHILCIFIAYFVHISTYLCIFMHINSIMICKAFRPEYCHTLRMIHISPLRRRTSRRFQDDSLLKKKQRSSPRRKMRDGLATAWII